LCGFVESAVLPGSLIVTDDWSGYGGLRARGYDHHPIAECGDPEVAEEFLPMTHLVFSNLKAWLNGIHHGVSAKHLGVPQRIHVPLQPPLLPIQCVPVLAGDRRRGRGADICRALFRGMAARYM
jgi:ISXO2-like transposase domain